MQEFGLSIRQLTGPAMLYFLSHGIYGSEGVVFHFSRFEGWSKTQLMENSAGQTYLCEGKNNYRVTCMLSNRVRQGHCF